MLNSSVNSHSQFGDIINKTCGEAYITLHQRTIYSFFLAL